MVLYKVVHAGVLSLDVQLDSMFLLYWDPYLSSFDI